MWDTDLDLFTRSVLGHGCQDAKAGAYTFVLAKADHKGGVVSCAPLSVELSTTPMRLSAGIFA